MIADLKQGNLDWVDQVPFNAVNAVKKTKGVALDESPGAETTNITWNSNPRKPKNRELLDPRVKQALSMCVDRDQIINVVFQGYANTVESLVGHISPLENPNLGPLKYDCAAGNAMLDKLGYKRGADGIRIAPATTGKYAQPAHPMAYDVITPTSTDFNVNREFQIVQAGLRKAAGVKVTQKVGGDSTAVLRARDRLELRRREEHRLHRASTSRCGTGSATSTRTSCSPSSRRASGARGATPAGTTPPTTSSTCSRARRSTRRSGRRSSGRCRR